MEKDEELARLEAAVYSRAGSAESVVDFVDPVTGETVRATPSEFRLRALRAERAKQSAGRGDRDRFARSADAESAGPGSLAMPPLELAPSGPPRPRFALPLVAVAAFAAGIVTALIVTWALASFAPTSVASAGSAPLLIFDLPSRYPDIAVPDLGDQFVPDSIRNVSASSPAEQGFGVYVGRETGSGLYCLIVQNDEGVTASSCLTADEVAERGLSVQAAVTLRSPVVYNVTNGETEVAARLSTLGEFSMSFPTTEHQSIDPPTTAGTTLATFANEAGARDNFEGFLDGQGEGLIVALDCLGAGTVTVVLDGAPSVFACTAGSVQSYLNEENTAHGELDVTVSTRGSVVWGLTIARTPVTEPAED